MEDPLLDDYKDKDFEVEKEYLSSLFYKDNREQEGNELPLGLKKLKINELILQLKTSRFTGISQDPKELKKRIEKYGKNTLIPDTSCNSLESKEYSDVNFSKKKSWWRYVKEHFRDRIWKILFICSFLMIGIAIVEDYQNLINMKLGDYVVGITVLVMLLIIMLMSIFVEAKKHNALLKMLRSIEESVETTVIRDGKEFLIQQSEVLVGDIIVLSGGDLIPADCLVIEANNQAQVDESYLTPDINPVKKKALKMSEYLSDRKLSESKSSEESIEVPDPFLLASTLVVAGRIKALVWAVGNNTYVRSKNLHSPYYTMMGEKRTILHSKVERIVSIIGRVGFGFAFLIFICLISRLIYMKFYDPMNNVVLNNMNMAGAFFYLITYFFTLLIFLIPVSISKSVENVITYAIAWLVEENVICLTKSAPENMARIDQLLIEKGGTLTTKKMEVVEIDAFDNVHSKLDSIDEFKRDIIIKNLAVNVVHLNSIGRIVKNLNNENKHIGNRMECAFLEFLTENGVDYNEIRK